MQEALVVAADPQDLERIGALVRVLRQLPPRLLIVVADEGAFTALAAIGGIQVVRSRPIPKSLLAGLSASERLFAEAWSQQGRPKVRVGDGQPWDAPGFEPPDPETS